MEVWIDRELMEKAKWIVERGLDKPAEYKEVGIPLYLPVPRLPVPAIPPKPGHRYE